MPRRSLGRQFGWLWTAYAVSAYGSGLGFGAFPLIAVLVLHASPAEVSALSAVGPSPLNRFWRAAWDCCICCWWSSTNCRVVSLPVIASYRGSRFSRASCSDGVSPYP